jgi:hypothetical protein
MPPKTRERTIVLTLNVDATTLRLDIFASLNTWQTLEQEGTKILFRIGARMQEMHVENQAVLMKPKR